MLDHLRQHVIDLLQSAETVTLSTHGPAGIQAQVLPCEACGMRFFLLAPTTSELLYNLEHQPAAVVTSAAWQLHGRAHTLSPEAVPPELALGHSPRTPGCVILEVEGQRLQVGPSNGWGFSETIDLSDPQIV
ncbi:hypothetical protein [Promineifilum sp.]|uniref:hypothetical protein n=1 Tax=Promineifilum sp. TaxID=2664178 RepID=UPI0035AF6C03